MGAYASAGGVATIQPLRWRVLRQNIQVDHRISESHNHRRDRRKCRRKSRPEVISHPCVLQPVLHFAGAPPRKLLPAAYRKMGIATARGIGQFADATLRPCRLCFWVAQRFTSAISPRLNAGFSRWGNCISNRPTAKPRHSVPISQIRCITIHPLTPESDS
jgi:hypothetical protein